MKKLSRNILAMLTVTAVLIGTASCSVTVNTPSDDSSENTEPISAEEDITSSDDTNDQSADAGTVDPKTADYSKIDVTIPFDSGEEIVNFTNDMLAGKYDGKIVKCEGITSRRMNGNAMMQKQEDGSSRGFTWYIVDSTDPDDYPPEDARVEITGVVCIGEWDVRYLYVLPENVVIKDGSSDTGNGDDNGTTDSPAAEAVDLKMGVWWAKSEYDEDCYYTFNSDGTGSLIYQDYGIGVGYNYVLEGSKCTFEMGGEGAFVSADIAADGDGLIFNWEDGRVESLTYAGDADSFRFFSSYDLAEMAKWYYRDNNDGYEPSQAEVNTEDDGTVSIHLFDVVDDHTATVTWYYIDRFTAKGTDINGDPVDLSSYGQTYDEEDKPEVVAQSWDPDVIHRQVMLDDGDFFGVKYIGWIDPRADDLDSFFGYIDHILDDTGTYEDFEFTVGMPYDRFVSSDGGQELYLVIPFDSNGTVNVYQREFDPLTGALVEGKWLYSGDGEPFLLKCNASEIYSDVAVYISGTEQPGTTVWSPAISGDDGHVITDNETNLKVYDFTNYDVLSTPDSEPLV